MTVRSGVHTRRFDGADAATVRMLVQSEVDAGQHHCPPEWCVDDVESTVVGVKQVGQTQVLDRASG